MTGSYAWHVGTLVDGALTAQIPISQSAWSDVMDDAGTLSATMLLADPDVAKLRPYLIAEPCRCFLAAAYTDEDGTETFLAGGPIWTHQYTDTDAGKPLQIGAAGLWSYYDHRKILPVLLAGVNPASVTTELTASLGTIAKKLVQLAHTHTGGALPVVLPDDVAGTFVRDYAGADMTAVGQALRDLTTVDGGPEIQFVPRRRSDDPRFMEWVMRVGTPDQPLLSQVGADWMWDATTVKSSVSSISVSRDGSAMASRAWGRGTGSGATTLFSRADDATLSDAGFPLLEMDDSTQTDEKVQANLDGYTTGVLAQHNRPVETWTVKVRRDDDPKLGTYLVGDYVSINVGDSNPYLPNRTYRARISSRAGDDSGDVTLGLAPTLGGI